MGRNKEQTMNRLLAAAAEIIVTQGIGQVNCTAVSTRVGVNKALVYRYFRGWNGLLEALFVQLLTQIGPRFVTGSDAGRINILVAQEVYVLAFSQLVRDNPAFRVLLRWQRDHSETQLGQRLTELLDESIQGIAGSDTVDVGMIRLLIAGVTGLASASAPTEGVLRYLFAQLRTASELVPVSVDSYSESILMH